MMQIQAYQNHQIGQETPHQQVPFAPVAESHSSAPATTNEAPTKAAPLGKLMNNLKDNQQVQNYVKRMMAAIDSGSFDTQDFARQAPPVMQHAASQLGINLPQQLAQFSRTLARAGQPHDPLHSPLARFSQAKAPEPGLFQQLAAVNTHA